MACGFPISFHGGRFGSCGRGGWRREGHPNAFGPPAWLASRSRGPHHNRFGRGLCSRGPCFKDIIPHLWKTLPESPSWGSNIRQTQPKWQQHVDCDGFSPNEITVKISDGKIEVEGLHESTDYNGVTSEVRQMKRTIVVPDDIDFEHVRALFKPNGTLILKGFRKSVKHETAMMGNEKTNHKIKAGTEQNKEKNTTEPMRFQIFLVGNGLPMSSGDFAEDCVKMNSSDEITGDAQEMEVQQSERTKEDGSENLFKSSSRFKAESGENKTDQEMPTVWPTVLPKFDKGKAETIHLSQNSNGMKARIENDSTEEAMSTSLSCESSPTAQPTKTNDNLTQTEYTQELDMTKFSPETIEVKLEGDFLTVVGEQNELDPSTGKVMNSKILMKKFTIPSNVNSDLLISKLNKGHLTIAAPYRTNHNTESKIIPISFN